MPQPFYGDDLAHIHDAGFGGFARGCTPALLEVFEQAGIREGRIVELGCGSGISAAGFVDAGFQVVGLDVSLAMVAIARERVPSADFETGSLWRYRFPRCRVVTALGEVLCYVGRERERRDLRALFARIFAALEPGGLLIFDVAEVGLDRNRPPTFAEGDDWACLVRFEYDDQRYRLTRRITTFRRSGALYRRSQEWHILQLYPRREIAELLRSAGFRVRSVSSFGAQPLLPGRVGFIARKP